MVEWQIIAIKIMARQRVQIWRNLLSGYLAVISKSLLQRNIAQIE